jgi:hypothetical protein
MKDKRLKKGYGKHTKPITLTIQNGMPVALVSLGHRRITKMSISDIDILKDFSFYAHKRSDGKYVARSSQKGRYLHRLLLNPNELLEVDHVNGDPLDNTRGNLREATTIQNNLAKKSELVHGYSGIVQTRDYSEILSFDRICTARTSYRFMAIGPNGKHHGPYYGFDKDRPEDGAKEAALKRDELMLEEYAEHYEDHAHHNYGFIRWNVNAPKEVGEMSSYLMDQLFSAKVEGIKKLELLYPRETFSL